MDIKIIIVIVLFYIGSVYLPLSSVANFFTSLGLIDVVFIIMLILAAINMHKIISFIYAHPTRILAWIVSVRKILSEAEKIVGPAILRDVYADLVLLESGAKDGYRFKEDSSYKLLQPTFQIVADFVSIKQSSKK